MAHQKILPGALARCVLRFYSCAFQSQCTREQGGILLSPEIMLGPVLCGKAFI